MTTPPLVILGTGQLARMTAQAAQRLGVRVTVVGPAGDDTPAADVTPHHLAGDPADPAVAARIHATGGVVTLENEFIPPQALAHLESLGLPVFPSSRALGVLRDKFTQKARLRDAGIPVPAFVSVDSADHVLHAAGTLGWPLILKSRTHGYDGLGNARVDGPGDVPAAFQRLRARADVMAEAFVPFTCELACTVVRSTTGQLRTYDPVLTVQENHVCTRVEAPAPVTEHVLQRARAMAGSMMEAVDGVGCFTLELFLDASGNLLANEVAPRPHNSAHHTIDSCVTSQFENHVRAVLGWPLGDTRMHAPRAVMVNVLGTRAGPALADTRDALRVPGVHVHLYGKTTTRSGRKMGHVTACGDHAHQLEALARDAAARLRL